jgi:hypothetical protein
MGKQDLISTQILCKYYNVPTSFIDMLHNHDLIEVKLIENDIFISKTQIRDVEKLMRLHYELNINIEGIDAIFNLLKQVKSLKKEIITLNNKLNIYK